MARLGAAATAWYPTTVLHPCIQGVYPEQERATRQWWFHPGFPRPLNSGIESLNHTGAPTGF